MREILFRGKRTDNGKWIEGRMFRLSEDLPPLIMMANKHGEAHEVAAETVGQYTGKEICGKKLFEGDIVESIEDYDDKFGYPATSHFYSVVVWDEKNFCWAFKTNGYVQAFNDWGWYDTMKVGNIHDNPELLGGADNGE